MKYEGNDQKILEESEHHYHRIADGRSYRNSRIVQNRPTSLRDIRLEYQIQNLAIIDNMTIR
jgi:hypothetical protein